jgi:tetratricopeptide (TPR) repeat protein
MAPAEAAAAYLHVGSSKVALDDYESAVEYFRLAETLMPEKSAIGLWAHLGWCYGRAGQIDDAERILQKLRDMATTMHVSHGAWTWAYLGVRDDRRALSELREAINNPNQEQISYPKEMIKQNFLLDPILDQPEFVEVRSRLGFTEL